MRLHRYRTYDDYVTEQVKGNSRKLDQVWVRRPVIEFAAAYLAQRMHPTFGLCHGTRRGCEQQWFRQALGCEVLGTEIAPTATRFPHTIRWDFHDPRPEWLDSVDFIYSNSLDHAYDPERALRSWLSCLRPRTGLCILEHSRAHGPTFVTPTDPFGAELEELLELIPRWGGRVSDVLTPVGAKIVGTQLVVVKRGDE